MPYKHRLQARRFELKYLVNVNQADAIRAFILNHLEADEFTRPDLEFGYSVRSLYLDTHTLKLKKQTEDGLKNRFKLRIRFYDDNPQSPAFLEIKRRENQAIRKERAAVSRSGVRQLLAGDRPDRSALLSGNGQSVSAMENFCALRERIGADGSVFVVYKREAYVSPNSDELRVTFDRKVESRRYEPGKVLEMPAAGVLASVDGVIFEVKFTDRYPYWMREMVQLFELESQSMPKYVECIKAETRRMDSPLALRGLR